MKFKRTKIILTAALALAGGFSARAQSNNPPAATDYAQFSRFITDRNIFDPNRYLRTARTNNNRVWTRQCSFSAPTLTLVGTMTYEKGMFAFFDGNNSDLKKILVLDGNIAGYTVKEITLTGVKLQGADKKEIEMKIGEQMRQEGGSWQLIGRGETPLGSTTTEAAATTSAEGDSSTDSAEPPASAPSSNLEGNDVLKRLMQKREQENK